jgi:hypothetical protein
VARRGTCYRVLSLRIDLFGKLRRPAQMEETIAEILANALAPWGVQFVEVSACLDPPEEDEPADDEESPE